MPTREIMFDTTYILPVFGVDLRLDSASSIQTTLASLRDQGTRLYISDLSPFEAFIKSYRAAERLRDERGKHDSKLGLLYVTKGGWATRIEHNDEEIIEEAFKIRNSHKDPFDCFIFATAKARHIPLVTEDDAAIDFIGDKLVMKWAELKRDMK